MSKARPLPLLAMLFLCAPALAQEPAPSARDRGVVSPAAQPATLVVDRFHAALRSGDTKAALALLIDDALIFEGGNVERGKVEYASHHLDADAEFSKAVKSTLVWRWGRAAGPIAWVSSESRTNGTFRGRMVVARNTETMVLRQIGKSWKIAHIHWSSANSAD